MSPHQVSLVWAWWHKEIAPWKSLILGAGGHEARRFDTLPPLQQFYYDAKYRYDYHFYYQGTPPPPQEMWEEGILDLHTEAARLWYLRRDIAEMEAELSDS